MKSSRVRQVLTRSVGTVVLLGAFVAFLVRAPFMSQDVTVATDAGRPALAPPVAAGVAAESGTLRSPLLPAESPGSAGFQLRPMFGLFDAAFAATDNDAGFRSSEVQVAGNCAGAGQRYFEAECPGCELLGGPDAGNADMLLWSERVDGRDVMRSVSRDCIGMSPAGLALVGTLTFGDGPADLRQKLDAPPATDRVPLLAGSVRVAAISMGDWFATYDKVPRPASALPDMAEALARRGWREVSDPGWPTHAALEGQRVFINPTNWLCMISLTRQGDDYQLLTIINSRV